MASVTAGRAGVGSREHLRPHRTGDDRRRGARRCVRPPGAGHWARRSSRAAGWSRSPSRALLASAYPRLRPGARAVLRRSLRRVGRRRGHRRRRPARGRRRFSGDDATVLLAGVAGLVLIIDGCWRLWCTRRLDERLPRRYARRALVGRRRGAGRLLRAASGRVRDRRHAQGACADRRRRSRPSARTRDAAHGGRVAARRRRMSRRAIALPSSCSRAARGLCRTRACSPLTATAC